MSRKISIEEVKQRISKYNIKLINGYINTSEKATFKCFCGQIFDCYVTSLITGKTKSCGCYNKKILSDKRLINLENMDFDRLKVIKLMPKDGDKRKYLCKCRCGNEKIICGQNLKRGITRSCGCLNDELKRQRRGIKSHRYNPNLTDEDRRLRKNMTKSKIWAKEILIRDDYTCKICFTRKSPFNAHHLDGWNWCKERRFDLENGITLCKKCHNKFHSKYGNGNNTKEQFVKFEELGNG